MRYTLALLLCSCAIKPSFDEKVCPFEVHPSQVVGQTFRCGVLKVPERYERATRAIDVPVIVFKGTKPLNPPIVYLSGGPGQSWADLGLNNFQARDTAQLTRDLVFLEQRGTGLSFPSLNCQNGAAGETDAAYLSRCSERLKKIGFDVAAFNTREMAQDVESMRLLLGYDKLILNGVSYGTAWALEVMRENGEHLAGVILDSVLSPTSPPLARTPEGEITALQALFAECGADTACKETFGDIEDTMKKTLAKVQMTPLAITGSKRMMDGSVFFSLTLSRLKSNPGSVPLFIQTVRDSAGPIDLGTPSGRLPAPDDHMALGQYLSVACSDNQIDIPPDADAIYGNIPDAYRKYATDVTALLELCMSWPYQQELAAPVPVTSTVPTLILSGRIDAITPSAWAREVAQTLPNATLVEVAGAGHDVVSWSECARGIARSFVASPGDKLDTACLADEHVTFETSPPAAREVASTPTPEETSLKARVPRW